MKMEKSQQTTQKYKGSWDYYQQVYANKMDHLGEMDKFLEKYNFFFSNLDSFYFFFGSDCCGQNFQNYVE